jgi:LEA14-like dessication related protein
MPKLPIAGLAALLLLGACSLTHFEAPQLSIASVQIVSTDVWQQRLRVRLHVHNPNDIALPVKGIEYSVELAGQQFASGTSDASFTVPALGDAEFDTTLTTNIAGALIRILASGGGPGQSIDYHLTGKVTLQGFMRTLPFDQRGSFKLSQ